MASFAKTLAARTVSYGTCASAASSYRISGQWWQLLLLSHAHHLLGCRDSGHGVRNGGIESAATDGVIGIELLAQQSCRWVWASRDAQLYAALAHANVSVALIQTQTKDLDMLVRDVGMQLARSHGAARWIRLVRWYSVPRGGLVISPGHEPC